MAKMDEFSLTRCDGPGHFGRAGTGARRWNSWRLLLSGLSA